MSESPCKDKKNQMRLNIIRHRQKLLQHLVRINDTDLKPKIKLETKDFEKFDLNFTIDHTLGLKVEPEVKTEIKAEIKIEETTDKELVSYDDISISSQEENWIKNCLSSYETDSDSRRRSTRLKEAKHSEIKSSCIRKKRTSYQNNDYDCVDKNDDKSGEKQKHTKSFSVQSSSSKPKMRVTRSFKTSHDRHLHNAKERECRNIISELFSNLGQFCSYLDCKRRFPSKHSILLAAKKECDMLVHYEKKLLVQKNKLLKSNSILLKKLLQIDNNIKSID